MLDNYHTGHNCTVEQYLRLSSLQIDDARLLLQNSALKFLLPI